ncbi:MAG TPA: hypothetical protein VF543_01710 [Pyrinomonadaceae bacterium]
MGITAQAGEASAGGLIGTELFDYKSQRCGRAIVRYRQNSTGG